MLPPFQCSSTPIPHVAGNVEHYLRLTSPLRRYNDLLNQWQADAYLKAEAENKEVAYPFSLRQVQDLIPFFNEHQMEAFFARNNETVSWFLRALFRAFHFKEAELPEIWDVQISKVARKKYSDDDSRIRGVLLPFKIQVKLLESPEKWEAHTKLGSYLPVKLEMVNLSEVSVSCRAVGPASDDYTVREPIRIVPKAKASNPNKQE
jgi:hypothetical protein